MNSLIPNAKEYIKHQAFACDIQEMESCFDDLRNSQALATAYLKDKRDDDVMKFCDKVNKLQSKFKEAIKRMESVDGPEKIKECLEAYKEALGGLHIEWKFTLEWKKIVEIKVSKMINNSTNDDN